MPSRYGRLLAQDIKDPLTASLFTEAAKQARGKKRFEERTVEDARKRVIWDVGTEVAGPALTLFSIWLLNEARGLGLKRLLYFARDGQLPHRISERIRPLAAPDIELNYCYASRQALFLPAAVGGRDFVGSWFARHINDITLRKVMGRIEVSGDAEFAAVERAVGQTLDWDRPLSLKDEPWLDGFLDKPAFWSLVQEKSDLARKRLMAYLDREGMLSEPRLGVVDLGWNGRLQRAFSLILRAEGLNEHADALTGFYVSVLDKRLQDDAKFRSAFARRPLCPDMFETYAAADHGTTLGYQRDVDGKYSPLLAPETAEPLLQWGVKVQQEAILSFADALTEAWARHPELTASRLWSEAADAVYRNTALMTRDPLRTEAEVYGGLRMQTPDQLHQDTMEFAPRLNWLGAAPASNLSRLGSSAWKSGVLRRSLPDPIYQLFRLRHLVGSGHR